MNKKPLTHRAPRAAFALRAVAVAALAVATSGSWALGLGRMAVQSALGESLRAEIDVTSITAEEASSLRVRIAPPDAYRAAGVEYSSVLPGTQVTLARRSDGRSYLRLASDRVVQEPFVDVILELTWASGRLVREYTMLLDPPTARAAATPPPAAPAVSPVISAAPAAAPAPAPAPAPVQAPRAIAPATAAPPAAAAPRAAAPSPSTAAAPAPRPAATTEAAGDEYRVRTGDTLSRIAARTQREGASLDQMLVALWRSNAQAFIDNNMNRLKAGSLLTVPSAADVKGIAAAEARQVIQAQSADFGAYRQRLASGAPAVKTSEPARQATGKVQAQVDDKKAAAAASPDRLTLSQGGVKAGSDAAKVSKESEKKDQTARVAELSRNVEDLKKLKDGTGAAAPKPGAAPAAPAVPAQAAPVAPAKPAPVVVAAAPPPPPPAPTPAPTPAPAAPAPTPAPVADTSATAAAPVASPVAASVSPPKPAAPAASAPPVAAKPAVAAKPPAAPLREEPSFVSGLLDNPFVLPGAGVVLALLAGLGVYRWRSRARSESGETSFLESRLQPDSFFGASGGQRIDTRDASGASSSMSYSLSQLDAIGDVDPVAEADVYLAYGRDLQAEEILKEAMRSNPDRLAIRTKLLEVYAKRRDTKGYELLATQLYSLTKGEGDEWHKAQELGQQIDPENSLYKPGGRPSAALAGGAAAVVEPLGASTMPQSVLPPMSNFALSEVDEDMEAPPVDVDLDLDSVAPARSPQPTLDTTQPLADVGEASFELPPVRRAAPAQPTEATAKPFDLDALSLDLGTPAAAGTTEPALDFSSMDSGHAAAATPLDPTDPLVRKFELAEEFRQIGDKEGARDLLEEVVAKASGPLKARAQGLLDSLA